MKIFVTGLSGFIGKHLIENFAPEDEIYYLSRSPIVPILPPNFKSMQGDLAGTEKWFSKLEEIRPDVCIHLAWQGIPDFSFYQCHWNLSASANLFRHLVEKCGCKKIISTGSCFEYGMRFGSCHEYNTLGLNSHFAWAKHSLMDFGMMLAKKHEIDFIWARLFYVYGSGQREDSLVPRLRRALLDGSVITEVIKTPHDEVDLINVKDVARALIKMIEINGQTAILNVGSGESIPVWKICEYVEDAMGMTHANSGQLKHTPQPEWGKDFWANISYTQNKLNWEPTVSIEEGIRDYIKETV